MKKNRFTEQVADARVDFKDQYAVALKQLKGLSEDDLKAITPETNSSKDYAELIKLVQKATTENMKQAELISNIRALGDVAVKIAKKFTGLM